MINGENRTPSHDQRGVGLTGGMSGEGDYQPSSQKWVRDQVAAFEASNGSAANTLRDTGMPIVVVTNRGRNSGAVRKTPVMRVEHDGRYLMVASQGGAPKHPAWYYNLLAEPVVELQDGATRSRFRTRVLDGQERELWWERAVAEYPPYADYQRRTDRVIPVLLLEPV